MRIVSMVPSWTETLLEAGLPVVGRTRFCLYPQLQVQNIPIVGGTKAVDWDSVRSLKPDILILDREENPREFSEQGIPFWASHVLDGESLQKALQELSDLFHQSRLAQWAEWSDRLNQQEALTFPALSSIEFENLSPWDSQEEVTYVIWRDPWMCVSEKTYIGFVLQKIGFKLVAQLDSQNRYPTFEMDMNQNYLFSSEPFPFLKFKNQLKVQGYKGSIVDGEKVSWYGIRSLRFLQKVFSLPGLE